MLADSPFTSKGAGKVSCTLGELRAAVVICSTDLEDFAYATSTTKLWPVLKMQWWKRRTRASKINFLGELKAFDNYYNDFYSVPEVWKDDSDAAPLGAPWPLVVAASLMRKTAMTRKEIWTLPIGEAIWTNAAILEQEGAGEIATAEMIEVLKALGYGANGEEK